MAVARLWHDQVARFNDARFVARPGRRQLLLSDFVEVMTPTACEE